MPKFSLSIPFDASQVDDFKPDQKVKVLVKSGKERKSEIISFGEKGDAVASFAFSDDAGSVRILAGPADASDQELEGLDTLVTDIPRRLIEETKGKLPVIVIPSYFWWWWKSWCRTFTIRGRVQCADGSPVPGAKVCALDVDWWFYWKSTQQIGCAYTDATGSFELKFRWCCGWWPWWWWKHRIWDIDSVLSAKISEVMARIPDFGLKPPRDTSPSLDVFEDSFKLEGKFWIPDKITPENAPMLENLRKELLARLPADDMLEKLRIWPWTPWHPWRDCTPDVIFRVTQDCAAPGTVIYEENVTQTRWDIPTSLNVTLIANDKACCRRICNDPPCEDGECMVITRVCGVPINEIGGNMGAPASPAGYYRPGAVAPGSTSADGDRPFSETVTVEKNSGAMVNVDYYEIQWHDGTGWTDPPPGSLLNFSRTYMHMLAPLFPTANPTFDFVSMSDGSTDHTVVKSKEYFEANSGLGIWGFNYIWIANEFLVVPIDSSRFPDGAHRFQVVGWEEAGGVLTNGRVLPICATKIDNSLVLRFDKRVVSAAVHPAAHNCGSIHVCTLEPDTHISAVRIAGQTVLACGTVDAAAGDLEIDFQVSDPDGHLGSYTLQAHYGLNGVQNLLSIPGASVVPLAAGVQTGWNMGDTAGTYGRALAQGAVIPTWNGGQFRLTVKASDAFPIPCCYQLRLRAWKRNIVNCGSDYHNTTELSLGVGVCPPRD
ncbi:MAG: carboxypeptidase-like regulatory domain-containing protein [Aestuariivirga sp.]